MKLKSLPLIILAAIMAACGHTTGENKADTVNVAQAIEHPTKITTSQLGSKIRFVPLETSDSSLIGNRWQIAFTDDRAIVANIGAEPGVLVFDLADGRFLNRVGQIGQGPEDYSRPFFALDPVTSQMVFMSGSGGYIGFSPDGTYNGPVIPGHKVMDRPIMGIADSIAYTIKPLNYGQSDMDITLMRTNGEPVDSFTIFAGREKAFFPYGFEGITEYESFNGALGHSMQQPRHVKNQGKTYITLATNTLNVGNYPAFKEAMCDTVYRLTPTGVVPELVFDMGEHSIPLGEVNRRDVRSTDLIVTDVNVTPTKAVFGISRGWIGDEDHTLYIGTYDRQTGETRMALASEGITDDLGGFIPFAPAFSTPKGDLIGVLTTDDIEEWYAEHPDFPRPEWLNALPEDANPVLVIVSE